MIILNTVDQLNIELNSGNVSLFGAGHVALHILKYAANNKANVSCIYVSNTEGNPKDVMGISVSSIETLTDDCAHDITIIVCLAEKNCQGIEEKLNRFALNKVVYISDVLLHEVIYKNADYDVRTLETVERLQETVKSLRNNINQQTDRLLRFIPKPCLEYMIVNILDHCNLRCKGCDHFACIADEHFFPYENIYRDLERMSEIFDGDYIMKIAVMGGEPLLHPDLKEILKSVRYFFPYTTIRLTTNGLLLLKQDNEFWKICRENNVTIVNTKYPINLDYEAMQEKAKSEDVKFQFFEGTGEGYVKKSFKKIINLKGDSNPTDSFSRCHISNYGNILLDGKFYGCPFSVQSYRIFNKKFDQNLRMTEDDYIDIFKATNKEEFFQFAARPKHYCRYCCGISSKFPWERSRQEMSEWT